MKGLPLKNLSKNISDQNKSERELFEELLAQIPADVAQLVDRQMEIAVAIADAIENSNYKTRKEFAAAIGMKPSMLSRILAGNVNLTLKTITKIESALGTEIISINTQKFFQNDQPVISCTLSSFYNPQEPTIPFTESNVGNIQYLENDDIISGYDDKVKEEMIYGSA